MLDSTPIIHSEVSGMHPIVYEWLCDSGYTHIEHELSITKGRRVDFLATSPEGLLTVIECKVGSKGANSRSLSQLENYQSILGARKAVLAVSRDAHNEKIRLECVSRGHLYHVANCFYSPLSNDAKPLFDILNSSSEKLPFPILVSRHWGFSLATHI